jgi:hypothetical protein
MDSAPCGAVSAHSFSAHPSECGITVDAGSLLVTGDCMLLLASQNGCVTGDVGGKNGSVSRVPACNAPVNGCYGMPNIQNKLQISSLTIAAAP